jgi:hypothetical protein
MLTKLQILTKTIVRKSLLTLLFFGMVSIAFASLGSIGGGSKKTSSKKKAIVTNNATFKPSYYTSTKVNDFTLKNSFRFRGSKLLNDNNNNNVRVINVNTMVTYKKGNGTYVRPLKQNIVIAKTASPSIPTGKLQQVSVKLNF